MVVQPTVPIFITLLPLRMRRIDMRVVHRKIKIMVHHLIFVESINHLQTNPVHAIISCRQDCFKGGVVWVEHLSTKIGKNYLLVYQGQYHS